MAKPTSWASRIVGHRDVPPDDLVANPRNWRGHPPHQSQALGDVLSEVGWVQSVIHNVRTGRLIDGHLRVDMAKARGEATVPVVDVDLSEDEEALILATIDPIGALAEANAASLAELVKGIEIESEAVRAMLKSVMDEATPIIAQGRTDPDAVPEPSGEPITKRGDLWLLGDHRLLCGDATDPSDAAMVMDGRQACLMNTDPPYGVDYAQLKAGIPGYVVSGDGDITNDNLTDGPSLQAFLEEAISAALPHLTDNPAFYLWHPMLTQGTFFAAAAAAAAADILIHRQIIWVKPGFVLTRSGMYHWKHELCFYGWIRGKRCEWYGDKSQVSVWEIGTQPHPDHPTQKPVELFRRPMLNHTRYGECVYEPFAGSGSQFIAAEELDRRCYGLEIEPRYCDVIVRRWEEFTGKKAERHAKSVDTAARTGVGVPR